jgi:ribonuclease HII
MLAPRKLGASILFNYSRNIRNEVIFPHNHISLFFPHYEYDDSKKLTRIKREALFELLTNGKIGRWGVGEASLEEIEKNNILVASQIAMARALEALADKERVVLVDGLPAKHLKREHIAVVGGDGRHGKLA